MIDGTVRLIRRVHREGTRGTFVLLAALCLALWHVAPLLREPWFSDALVGTDSYRSHDWLEVAKFDAFARRAILEDGTWPWWNPLIAGGFPQFAHPSDGVMGPLFLPSLLLGETRGMKVVVVLASLLGTLGVGLLARTALRASLPATFLAAGAFAWSGWLPSRVAIGFYESCLMAAWPLVLALWFWPPTPRRPLLHALAALLVWALAIQLQLAVPVLVLAMAILVLGSWVQRGLGGPVLPEGRTGSAVRILAVGGLLGAAKFLPMLDLLSSAGFREATRYPSHADAWFVNFRQLWYGLFHTVPAVPILDQDGSPRIQEYLCLLPGQGTLLLAGAGAVLGLRPGRRGLPWVLLGGTFLWLSFGPHAPVDLFRVLHPLPLFSSMRGPLRYFTFPLLLSVCMLAAVGVDALREAWARWRPLARVGHGHAWVVALLALALNLPSATAGRLLYRSAFLYAVPLPAEPELPLSEGLYGSSLGGAQALNLRKYTNTLRSVPTVFLPEDLPIPVAPVPQHWLHTNGRVQRDPAYLGEAWPIAEDGRALLTEPVPSQVRVVSWRADGVEVETTLPADGWVAVNQNHRPGWRCGDRPTRSVERDGGPQLAFLAPAGDGVRTLCRYRPPLLLPGLALSALGVVGLVHLVRRPSPRA